MRYRAYRSVDGIPENEEGIAVDKYDKQPNARTHLIWYDGKPVASARSLIWSFKYNWEGTTCVDAYRKAIEAEFGVDIPLLESNRYVVDPEFLGRKSLTAQYLLFRIQTMSCLFDRCKYVITAVRNNHIPFYERLMGFTPFQNLHRFQVFSLRLPYLQRLIKIGSCSPKKRLSAEFQLEDYEKYIEQFSTLITA